MFLASLFLGRKPLPNSFVAGPALSDSFCKFCRESRPKTLPQCGIPIAGFHVNLLYIVLDRLLSSLIEGRHRCTRKLHLGHQQLARPDPKWKSEENWWQRQPSGDPANSSVLNLVGNLSIECLDSDLARSFRIYQSLCQVQMSSCHRMNSVERCFHLECLHGNNRLLSELCLLIRAVQNRNSLLSAAYQQILWFYRTPRWRKDVPAEAKCPFGDLSMYLVHWAVANVITTNHAKSLELGQLFNVETGPTTTPVILKKLPGRYCFRHKILSSNSTFLSTRLLMAALPILLLNVHRLSITVPGDTPSSTSKI